MSVIIKCVVLFVCSLVFVRLSGKKSLSQMTIATTVVMISVGAVMVGPLVDKGLGKTVAALGLYVGLLWVFEWFELRSKFLTKLMTPPPTVVIENGVPYEERLKKLHMTFGQLNTRLRKAGIGKLSDVEIAVIESNGELSYELIPEARPLTVRDLHRILMEFGLDKESQTSLPGSFTLSSEPRGLEPSDIETDTGTGTRNTTNDNLNRKKLSPLFQDLR